MVPLQESPQCSNSNRFNSSSNSNSNSISNNTKSHSWFMGRSMRTVRSNLYHHHSSSDTTTTTTFHAAPIDNNLHHYHYSPSTEFLTDSVIDLRLGELAASHKSDLHWNNNNHNNNIDSGYQSDNNNSESSSFLCKLLQLDDLSRAFSASSSCSDISGELRRLAAATTTNDVHDDEATHNHHEEEEEPCPGFLERDSFSTEIIDIISPEDLLPTVKLCVDSLSSPSTSVRRSAAAKIRLLAKNRSDNRAMIGEYTGAVPSLINLLRSTDPHTQEHAVTALLNLSLHDGNRDLMSDPVAVKSLIYVLKTGTETSKQNAACALLNLSLTNEGTRMTIGACGAILPLVSLLINGSTRGKKDALTTLYKLCSGGRVNKERAVSAGAVGPLVGMMMAEQQGQQQYCEGLMEKAMVVLSSLAGIGEGREAIVEEGGIAVLVEAIDHDEEVSRSHKVKEFAVMTLLQLCIGDDDDNDESVRRNRGLLIREGGIPPLAALSQSGTLKAKHKAETLLRYLREPRQEASTSASP